MSVVDPVAQAATISNQASGMRMNVTMRLTSSALPAPIAGNGEGAFNVVSHTGTFSVSLDFRSIPQVAAVLGTSRLRIDEIMDGATVYLRLPAALERGSATHGKPWVKIDLANAAKGLGASGFSSLLDNPASTDPSQFLRYLHAASGSVTKVGSATVDGTPTTQYRATIQLNRVPNGFPAAQRAQVRKTIATLQQVAHIRAIPVNVWVDDQHLVRRMEFSIAEAVSGETVNIGLRIDIPQYGPQPTPHLPPASQVTDLTGGVGSSSAGPSSAASVAG